ncbi:MAG: hypothetical protein AAFN43_12055 [Pseudomonadota bacterium]
MIIALLRTIYFVGPLLALAIVLMPKRKQVSWTLWCVALAVVAFHWISFFSAQEDNATQIGTLWAAVWTPLLVTTGIARLIEHRWRGWHSNPYISQGFMCLLCLLPSIAAFFSV